MDDNVFSYKTKIKEIYLDSFGHMNNANYLTLFEEARWEGITRHGYGLQKIKDTGLGPVMLEVSMRWQKELVARDEITIETQLISYVQKIAKIRQRMLKGSDVCCTAEFTLGLFDLKQRKLVLPTPEWLAAVGFK